jgi:hypothetical protein
VKPRHSGRIDHRRTPRSTKEDVMLISKRRPVLLAAMVGGGSETMGRIARRRALHEAPQRWVAELEGLRAAGALTADEFDSAKRHLLAG